GRNWPGKQPGQFGQASPESVARTTTPITTSRNAAATVAAASRWKRVNEPPGWRPRILAPERLGSRSIASASPSADRGYSVAHVPPAPTTCVGACRRLARDLLRARRL